jgi:hypothetical protein
VIIKILEARDVTWVSISLANRRNPRAEADELDLTILISARHDTSSNSWYLALHDIFDYHQGSDLSYIRVEIIDWEYSRALANFIMEPSHPLVFVWPKICNRIIEALGTRPWLTLTAIHRGTYKIPKQNPVIILITVPDSSSLCPVLTPIMSICANEGFPLEAEVFEESSLLAVQNPGGKRLEASAFTDVIPMGSSISAALAQDRSDTMGGAIILSKNNLHVHIGVTNFHVMSSQNTPKSK